MELDPKILHAIANTEVVRPPRQSLATFGITNIYYYLVTELTQGINVVREGRVIAQQPRIVTPAYLVQIEGFSPQARRFLEMMAQDSPHEPGVIYSYRNEPKEMNVASGSFIQVIENIQSRLEINDDPLSAIVKGLEDMWDVSLIKFTYELTRHSLKKNISELGSSGLFKMSHGGVPAGARRHIEQLFETVRNDHSQAPRLLNELKSWNLFEEYQDRFLHLFR